MSDTVLNATLNDLEEICQLFEEAIRFQKSNNYIGWNHYDKAFLQSDIEKELLFKITRGDQMLCIFSICYSDPLIWREKEKGDALYLHRIVLNQEFKGEKAFQKILDWAIPFALKRDLNFLRMDTWADNKKIIDYYKSYGFCFLENYTTPASADLPLQHRNLKVALLELTLKHPATPGPHLDKIERGSVQHQLQKRSIRQELATIHKYWSQKIIGQSNGQLIKLAKGIGEINWHKHTDQDELFILYKGHLTIQLRDKNIELYEDELFIVPRGVEHCPRANGHTEFLVMGLNITSNAAGGRPEWAEDVEER